MKSSPMAALALAASIALIGNAAFGQAKGSKEFLIDAMQGNLAEVQVGQLAQTKGNTEGVRQFGGMLATDHAMAQDQDMKLASSLGVTPPAAPKPEAKHLYDKLSKLSGAGFDAEFLRAMVDDHQKDIQEFKTEASSGGGATARLASNQLPVLEKHLATAQTLEKQATSP
jgi:putative membrane protein